MSLSYSLFLADKRIASGVFIGVDDGMGVAVGTFLSEPAYEPIRPLFEALSMDGAPPELWAQRDALPLQIRDEDGAVIAAAWIHIFDFRRAHGDEDAAEINVALTDVGDVERLCRALGIR